MAGHGNVKIINNDSEFLQEISKAGSKLVIIDFHATWCGPCHKIAPFYTQESLKYPNVIFLKVDVDKCTETSEKFGISAMPTFVFVKNGNKIDEVRGANESILGTKIQKHAGAAGGAAEEGSTSEECEVPGHTILNNLINSVGCNCLNESDSHPHANIFKDNDAYLESDCDEQLLLTVTFNQAVKIHSLKFTAPSDGKGPKFVKIFSNQPTALGFDQAEGMEGVQHIELTPEDITGDKIVPLRYVKFQNVSNIVLFVANNQGGDDITVLKHLKIIGSTVESTNMGEFKRVAGKAGESH